LLQAESLNRTAVNASAAINAGIRINRSLAIDHANRVARTLINARLTPGAFFFIYYSWHLRPLSKTENHESLQKVRNHNESSSNYNPKIREICGSVSVPPWSIRSGSQKVFSGGRIVLRSAMAALPARFRPRG
jgi:hypothetical protein